MNSGIVSIQHSAAFVHTAAMRCLHENKLLRALELLRIAVEKAPQNRKYQLDLADLYAQLGQYRLSNRVLLDMAGAQDAPEECFYMLAMNQTELGSEDYANRALAAYGKRHPSEDDYADALGDIRDALDVDLSESVERDACRKLYRLKHDSKRAAETGGADSGKRLEGLFESGSTGRAVPPILRCLFAVKLKQQGETERAEEEADKLTEDGQVSFMDLSAVVKLLWDYGFRDQAKRIVQRMLSLNPEDALPEPLESVLMNVDMPEETVQFCNYCLQDAPYSKKYLHMRAAALCKSGAPVRQAAADWKKIVQTDPEDAAAAYWLEAAARGEMDEEPDYICRVPQKIEDAWHAEIVRALQANAAPDASLRTTAVAVLNGEDRDAALNAAKLLALSDEAKDIGMLREYLYRESTDEEQREAVRAVLRGRGIDPAERFPAAEVDLPQHTAPLKELLKDYSVSDRQLVRCVTDILLERYREAPGKAVLDLWMKYKSANDANHMECAAEAAAALTWNYLLSIGRRPEIRALTQQFGCAERRMIYYARHMAAVLEGCAENEDH